MMTIIFASCFVISVAVIIYMIQKCYENVDVHYWSMLILIPVILMGYTMKTVVKSPDAAYLALCFIYLDSTILPVILIFSIMRFLNIQLKTWIKIVAYILAFAHLALVCSCFNNELYYSSMTLVSTGNGIATKMGSGPLKYIHYVYLIADIVIVIACLIIGYTKKKTASHHLLNIYSTIIVLSLVTYLIEGLIDIDFSLLPYIYVIADVTIAIDYDRIHVYDISCLISEQQKYHGTKGFVAFDLKRRFKSCNKKAYDFLPELKNQRVDALISDNFLQLKEVFYSLIDSYKKDPSIKTKNFNTGDLVCQCEIATFSNRNNGKIQGYLFDIRDVTEEQKLLKIMKSYNDTLNIEVQKKTENIIEIQQKVVLGLANMVENRDNNTGGHVKRTSDIIKYLVDEIKKQGIYKIDEQKSIDIIRSAPMHDLGKISIDSSILCKPGRLTDEEFAVMKSHSTKSGEIVKLILQDVEEQHFVNTAFNVARYHHERWDGKGYPEGLVGEMIPLEARIMAVADVYDALVSKRCYKEPMSFEQAANIMLEGMGTQFDPSMASIFIQCQKRLEDYYRQAGS